MRVVCLLGADCTLAAALVEGLGRAIETMVRVVRMDSGDGGKAGGFGGGWWCWMWLGRMVTGTTRNPLGFSEQGCGGGVKCVDQGTLGQLAKRSTFLDRLAENRRDEYI